MQFRSFILVLALACLSPAVLANHPFEQTKTITTEGLEISLSVTPLNEAQDRPIAEGDDVVIRMLINDAELGQGVSGLYPAAWVDRQRVSKEEVECGRKVASFMQGVLSARPDLDLNSWYILTLNAASPNISVVDPLVDFSGQKTLTTLVLKSHGEDWAVNQDQSRVFITQPESGLLAVADTRHWRIINHLDVGERPMRVVMQPDDGFLWIGNDSLEAGTSGVTVVDPSSMTVAHQETTGPGHHDFAFTPDSRWTFVSNSRAGTLHIFDNRDFSSKTIALKEGVNDIAYSHLSDTVIAVNAASGEIYVIDATNHKLVNTVESEPGLTYIQVSPDGRWSAILNKEQSQLLILDNATGKLRHTVGVGERPDQVVFTDQNIHVYPLDSEKVTSVALQALGNLDELPTIDLATGRLPPADSGVYSIAPAIVRTPDDRAVLIANPADRAVYYYMEGMVAPMGSFSEIRQPRAIMTINRSLRNAGLGSYETHARLPAAGMFDVAVRLDSPEVVACFPMEVAEDPQLAAVRNSAARVSYLRGVDPTVADRHIDVTFEVTAKGSGMPREGVKDLEVRLVKVPGTRMQRRRAEEIQPGVYKATFELNGAGIYYALVRSSSQRIRLNDHVPKEFWIRDEIAEGSAEKKTEASM